MRWSTSRICATRSCGASSSPAGRTAPSATGATAYLRSDAVLRGLRQVLEPELDADHRQVPELRTPDRHPARGRDGRRLQGPVALQADGDPRRALRQLPHRPDDRLARLIRSFSRRYLPVAGSYCLEYADSAG